MKVKAVEELGVDVVVTYLVALFVVIFQRRGLVRMMETGSVMRSFFCSHSQVHTFLMSSTQVVHWTLSSWFSPKLWCWSLLLLQIHMHPRTRRNKPLKETTPTDVDDQNTPKVAPLNDQRNCIVCYHHEHTKHCTRSFSNQCMMP